MYKYKARLIKVVDGDTIDVLVDLGFKTFMAQRPRLVGINTPEMHRPMGIKVRQLVIDFLHGKKIRIETSKRNGCYLATVYAGEVNLNQWLLDNGHAKPCE